MDCLPWVEAGRLAMKVDAELAQLCDERVIRLAEKLARQLGRTVEVFDADGNMFWVATPAPVPKLES